MQYEKFILNKSQFHDGDGFAVDDLPEFLFDFQKHLVEWALHKGRSAIFADCGLGKTAIELVWANEVFKKTGKPVLILTPLSVCNQTLSESKKFGIEAVVSKEGKVECGIVITNYERLHYFDAKDFSGVVCDESSILKSFGGKTRKVVTRFMSKMRYRLLATATAAPNDYVELGSSSEAIGQLSHSEMLKRFFRQLDDKGQKRETKLQDNAEAFIEAAPEYYAKLAFRVVQTIGQWRLKHHAVENFWRWVASWARACRMPSDLGFDDTAFILPELNEQDHLIEPKSCAPGFLFNIPAVGLSGEREERKRTLNERCRYVADLVAHDQPAIIWCQYNQEGDLLEKIIPNSLQIAGRHSDEYKEDVTEWFLGNRCLCNSNQFKNSFEKSADGSCCCGFQSGNRKLISKAKMFGFGLNFQHCNHVVSFATHSYEQYYQSIRRCWRFGQKRPVRVDIVATEGEIRVLANMRRKTKQADGMFDILVRKMNEANSIKPVNAYTNKTEVPAWL